jgi:hypothetical protein
MWPSTAGFLTKHVQDSRNSRAFPCGSRKLDHRAQAGDLYTGSYHRACRTTADALQPDRLLILSARHGLLDLDDVIDPYDTPHGTNDAITPQTLLAQATTRNILHLAPVIALGSAHHTSLVRTLWPYAHAPLTGTRGMGEQMARLAQLRKKYIPQHT